MFPRLLLVLALLAASSPCPSRAGGAVDPVIGRVLDAYGGTRLDSVTSYRMEGVVTARMRKTSAEMVRLFARPDRLFVDLAYDDVPERRYLDGERGWRTDPGGGGMVEVKGHLLKSMTLQAARADIPWILAEQRDRVTPIPPLKVGERMTVGMQIDLEPGLIIRLFADPASGLVLYSQAILDTGTLKTHFETAYSDFREVEGILFAHHEENWASGFHTGTTRIRKITLNPLQGKNPFRPE